MLRRLDRAGVDGADHRRAARPAAATPTPGSTPHAADGWPAQYADAANSSYSPTSRAPTRCDCDWSRSVKGDLGAAGGAGLGQLPGRQRADAGRLLADGVGDRQQRRASAGAPGCARAADSPSPLFDGFDNLYVGQPGRDAVVPADPVDPVAAAGHRNAYRRQGFSAPGQLLVVTHLGQVLVFDAHRGDRRRHSAGPGRRASTRRIRNAAWPTARRRGRAARSPPRPPSRRPPQTIVVAGRGSPAHRTPGAGRAEVPARPDPAAGPGVDQRRGHRRRAGQPGAVRRRLDRLRQRPRRSAVGAATPATASRNGRCR